MKRIVVGVLLIVILVSVPILFTSDIKYTDNKKNITEEKLKMSITKSFVILENQKT